MMKRPPKMVCLKKATKNTARHARAAASVRRLYNQVDLNDFRVKDESLARVVLGHLPEPPAPIALHSQPFLPGTK